MAPEDSPYVDPKTRPGDAGTEDWADNEPGSEDHPSGHGSPDETTDDDGVVEGSPADSFIHDADAVGARDEGEEA